MLLMPYICLVIFVHSKLKALLSAYVIPLLKCYIVANHIKCNLSKYERSLISQLRLGILPLHIETGRYSNLDESERICLLCDSNQVESEKHFLFECELYNNERSRLEDAIGVNLANYNDGEKFEFIFNHPFVLGKYIRSAIIKRRAKLYKSFIELPTLILLFCHTYILQ